jgi:hypothetical protein
VLLLDPAADNDADGMTNAAEVLAGTDPLDAASLLRIISQPSGNQLIWSSVGGKNYRVQVSADLTVGFTNLSGLIPSAGSTTSYTDSSATVSQRYYRVLLVP